MTKLTKRNRRKRLLGSGISKGQKSTLDLWQEHMAALKRASQVTIQQTPQNRIVTEQSIEPVDSPNFRI